MEILSKLFRRKNKQMTQEEKQFLFTYIMGMDIKLNQIFRLIINIVKKPGVNYDDVLKQFDDLTKIEKGE